MSPPDLSGQSAEELRALIAKLLAQVAALEQKLSERDEEIARLKGVKGRPRIKPSGMERSPAVARLAAPARPGGKAARRRLAIDEDRIVKLAAPAGSRFKGYEDFIVQDLMVRPQITRYRRERWLTPDGKTVLAPLPAGIAGHFGPELRRLVLALYHQGQVTLARLTRQVQAFGLRISKRQVQRLLTAGQDGFLDEAREVLRAGLAGAAWVSVDDTGARHQARNGVCTRIGNDHFTWFATTFSKSRLNFLELLRAGYADDVVNAAALAYMEHRGLAGPVIARLAAHDQKHFTDRAAWQTHLGRLGIRARGGKLDPARIATEGAVWGSIAAHGLLRDTAIISDDAGQFAVGPHGLCWVHAERLVHQLHAVTAAQHAAQQELRALIWTFYDALKAYRLAPTAPRRAELAAQFDRIFVRRTGFALLDRLLARLHANKPELLLALDRPAIPLHNNAAENDIRCQVTKRKISGGTRSDAGRDCRDAFLGLAKTCAKLGITFWDYLGARLAVVQAPAIPYLPHLISHRCKSA